MEVVSKELFDFLNKHSECRLRVELDITEATEIYYKLICDANDEAIAVAEQPLIGEE